MRLLLDQNVASKYKQALLDEGFHVDTVRNCLGATAADQQIASYAAANEYVVLSTDDDFFSINLNCGFLFYKQLEDPSPGDIVTAIQKIQDNYTNYANVRERVPDGWV